MLSLPCDKVAASFSVSPISAVDYIRAGSDHLQSPSHLVAHCPTDSVAAINCFNESVYSKGE